MSNWKEGLLQAIIVILLVMLVAMLAGAYGDYQYNKGLREGSLHPVREIENEIHNRGFELGWASGTGQPKEGLPDNDYVILINLSENEVLKTIGSNRTSNCYNLLIENHIKDIQGGYNKSLGAGWNGPEFRTVCK